MSEVKLELLKRFNTLHEANIVLSFLRSKDIDATIFDEHAVNIYATPAIFNGVRLMVPSHQLQLAQTELLSQKEFAENNPPELVGEACPKCKSASTEIINVNRKDLLWLIISYALIFPALKESSIDWLCHSCENKWTSKTRNNQNQALTLVIGILFLALIILTIYFYSIKNR